MGIQEIDMKNDSRTENVIQKVPFL